MKETKKLLNVLKIFNNCTPHDAYNIFEKMYLHLYNTLQNRLTFPEKQLLNIQFYTED